MDSHFWKVIGTLFGIGVAISFAKSLKSKKNWREVVSEMIISGFVAVSASVALIFIPPSNPFAVIGVVGLGALLAVLGVAFLSDKIEKGLQMAADKYLTKKDG